MNPPDVLHEDLSELRLGETKELFSLVGDRGIVFHRELLRRLEQWCYKRGNHIWGSTYSYDWGVINRFRFSRLVIGLPYRSTYPPPDYLREHFRNHSKVYLLFSLDRLVQAFIGSSNLLRGEFFEVNSHITCDKVLPELKRYYEVLWKTSVRPNWSSSSRALIAATKSP